MEGALEGELTLSWAAWTQNAGTASQVHSSDKVDLAAQKSCLGKEKKGLVIWSRELLACVFLRYLLIFLYHPVPHLSKTSYDLAPGNATAVGTAQGSFATKSRLIFLPCCQ